jgi:hypothetical protein
MQSLLRAVSHLDGEIKWQGSDDLRNGEGSQDIVFLHTAGSDGRQYHGVGLHLLPN